MSVNREHEEVQKQTKGSLWLLVRMSLELVWWREFLKRENIWIQGMCFFTQNVTNLQNFLPPNIAMTT